MTAALVTAHEIVLEKHDSSIKFNSSVGEGTEFVIQIPVQQ